jgi:hypothetical protein
MWLSATHSETSVSAGRLQCGNRPPAGRWRTSRGGFQTGARRSDTRFERRLDEAGAVTGSAHRSWIASAGACRQHCTIQAHGNRTV